MSPVAAAATSAGARVRARLGDPWTCLRVVLVLGWLAVALTAVLAGQRPASLVDLRAAVDSGRLEEVRVSEGPAAAESGYGVQSAVWRDGLVTHRTEVWWASPGVQAPQDDRPVIHGDLADELRAADAGVRIEPLVEPTSWSEVDGWRVPAWAALLLLADGLGVVLVLVAGPPPARATRWAWFWLAWPPVGTLAFLLLSGPFPGLPRPRPDGRRLTGGWAFLISCLLGIGVFSARG